MTAPIAYAPPTCGSAIDLDLSKNEGRAPRDPALRHVDIDAATLARYPSPEALQQGLAALYAVAPERLLVTAGADDALLRICLATLTTGRQALVASPTFEMIPRYVALARGTLREVPWPEGAFPIDAFLAAASERTEVAFVVSPNNPTGAVATATDLRRVAAALPRALVVLDAAYAEFAGDDLVACGHELDNVVVLRTMSKAWGLAGLRVGCAIGAPATLVRLRASGNPMPVSSASARYVLQRLATGAADLRDHVAAICREREQLAATLSDLGARPATPRRGNFVLARGVAPEWLTGALAALGIAVRRFPDRGDLHDAVRIGLPGDPRDFARLQAALATALAPAALLFDMDGVLVDVTESYRAAIVATAKSFGADVTPADIEARKALGNANDDWQLTRELMASRGVDRPLADVTARFEQFYRALRERERPMVDGATLRRWGERYRLAVVTGRPRADAEYFLRRFDLTEVFSVVICREDAAQKPDPAPVRLALERLGAPTAWMLGDTPDDLIAARAAGVLPIGVGDGAGDVAAATLDRPSDLDRFLP